MMGQLPRNLERRAESIKSDASIAGDPNARFTHARTSNSGFQAPVNRNGIRSASALSAPVARQPSPPVSSGVRPSTEMPLLSGEHGTLPSGEFSKFSDLELWQLFQKSSDERAFAELYQRHKADLYTYCLRMMSGDRDKASDIFQEVFIRAFEKSAQFRSGTNIAGWLYMIARNMCLNTHRNSHPAERLDGPDVTLAMLASTDRSLAPEYDEEQHFLRRKLEEALARLPLEFREPFMLREFDGFTYREIAAMTGITLGMTKVRIYRAKQRMRELLAPTFSA